MLSVTIPRWVSPSVVAFFLPLPPPLLHLRHQPPMKKPSIVVMATSHAYLLPDEDVFEEKTCMDDDGAQLLLPLAFVPPVVFRRVHLRRF